MFQIENKLRNRRINRLLHPNRALVPVLVSVPPAEGDVLGGDFDIPCSGFNQTTRQQASLAKAAGVIDVEVLLRLERQIECLRRGRRKQLVSRVQGAYESPALKIACELI